MNDTSPEMEKRQLAMMLKLGANRRIELGCEMFMAARELIFASLPENLPPRELKKRYYEQMYGESLPENFFQDEE